MFARSALYCQPGETVTGADNRKCDYSNVGDIGGGVTINAQSTMAAARKIDCISMGHSAAGPNACQVNDNTITKEFYYHVTGVHELKTIQKTQTMDYINPMTGERGSSGSGLNAARRVRRELEKNPTRNPTTSTAEAEQDSLLNYDPFQKIGQEKKSVRRVEAHSSSCRITGAESQEEMNAFREQTDADLTNGESEENGNYRCLAGGDSTSTAGGIDDFYQSYQYHPYAGKNAGKMKKGDYLVSKGVNKAKNSAYNNFRPTKYQDSPQHRDLAVLTSNTTNDALAFLLDMEATIFAAVGVMKDRLLEYKKKAKDTCPQIGITDESGKDNQGYSEWSSGQGAKEIGMQLRAVAILMVNGIRPRVFQIQQGLFDTHAKQAYTLDTDSSLGGGKKLIPNLKKAIVKFISVAKACGFWSDVLVTTFSDFGRRFEENARKGTDHGWGQHNMIFGKDLARRVWFVIVCKAKLVSKCSPC